MKNKEKAVSFLIAGLILSLGSEGLYPIISPELAKKILFYSTNIIGVCFIAKGVFFWKGAEKDHKEKIKRILSSN